MAKTKTIRRDLREFVRDCEIGDVVELEDGTVWVVCSYLNGGTFGREIVDDEETEFVPMDDGARIRMGNL